MPGIVAVLIVAGLIVATTGRQSWLYAWAAFFGIVALTGLAELL